MTTAQSSAAAFVSFRVLDSRSGNITRPSLSQEGTELNFEYMTDGPMIEVRIISTTVYRNFFYQLITSSSYSFGSNPGSSSFFTDGEITSLAELTQSSIKRHKHVFQQFNHTGLFKNCSVEEKNFEELLSMTSEKIRTLSGVPEPALS